MYMRQKQKKPVNYIQLAKKNMPSVTNLAIPMLIGEKLVKMTSWWKMPFFRHSGARQRVNIIFVAVI